MYHRSIHVSFDPEPGEVAAYLTAKGFTFKVHGSDLNLNECPFCDKEKFYINQDTGKYKCHSENACGATGNLITLKKHFGDYTKMPLRQNTDEETQRIWRAAVEYWQRCLFEEPRALKYWTDRGITEDTIHQHSIGYWKIGLSKYLQKRGYSEESILRSGLVKDTGQGILYDAYRDVLPMPVIFREYIHTFRFRVPKWAKSGTKNFSLAGKELFPYCLDSTNGNPEQVVIVEGEPDALILAQAGIPVVGLPGAGTFKEEWAKYFEGVNTVFVALDPDQAGEKGFKSISQRIGRSVYRVNMPDGKDVNDFFLSFETLEEGKEAFIRLMNQATCYSGGEVRDASIDHLIPPRGFIRDYIEYASEQTDAPKRFHLMGAFQVISGLLRNKVKIEFGAYTLKPNIYGVCLAGSSKFRKSTSLSIAKKVLRSFEASDPKHNNESAAGAKIIYPNEFSREAIYVVMKDRPSGVFFVTEMGGFLTSISRTYNEGLKEFFTDLYDSPDHIERQLKKEYCRVENPCASIYSASTIEWFVKSLTDDDLSGGFLYRFLYMPAREQERYMPLPPLENPEKFQNLIKEANGINTIEKGNVILSMAAKRYYEDWATRFHRKNVEKRMEPFIERYTQYALKLAILYELQAGQVDYDDEETKTYKLSEESLRYGAQAVEFFFAETQRLFAEELSFSQFEREQQQIKKALRESGRRGLSSSDLYRKTRGMKPKDRDDALQHLLQTGEITRDEIKTPGRRKTVYLLSAA